MTEERKMNSTLIVVIIAIIMIAMASRCNAQDTTVYKVPRAKQLERIMN